MHCKVRLSVYTGWAREQLGVLGGAGRGGGSLDIFAPGASGERGSVPAGWSRRLIEKLPRLASPQWPGCKKSMEGGKLVYGKVCLGVTSIPWTFSFMWSSRVVFPSFLFFQQ